MKQAKKRLAVHAADLDHERIDGTRVYIKNVLAKLGQELTDWEMEILHATEFNPMLSPRKLSNYTFHALGKFPAWTHTKFAWHTWRENYDLVWLPLHNLPWLRARKTKYIVTIHDLAFKIFPEHFPWRDRWKLNLLTDHAVRHADGIIAVSEVTKRDILRFYPEIPLEKIQVIHHGFDENLFLPKDQKKSSSDILPKLKIKDSKFILYVGAIQPRKNLEVLIAAFEKLKANQPELKLVLGGARAWQWQETIERISCSPYKADIIETGKLQFDELPVLYAKAAAFVFPSLYEGFGIPLLEAFAAGTPVVAANNSSLPEVGGQAALYFKAQDPTELADKLQQLLQEPGLAGQLREKGRLRAKDFSWEQSAKKTAKFFRQFEA